jgi:hypothetical protein
MLRPTALNISLMVLNGLARETIPADIRGFLIKPTMPING